MTSSIKLLPNCLMIYLLIYQSGFAIEKKISLSSLDVITWTFQTGKDIYAAPVIEEGIIYVGSLDSSFYAIEAETGEKKWQYKTDNPIQSTAAIFENIICFESGNQLYGLEKNGSLVWQFPLTTLSVTNQIDSWDFYHSSPNIVDGIAYIGTEKGLVFGVDVKTGTKVFEWQSPSKATIRIKPGIYENKLFVGDWSGVLYAFDLERNELSWSYDTRKDDTYSWTNAIQTPLVFFNQSVFFAGRSCNAYCLDINDGTRKWKFNEPNLWIVGGAVISDSVIYYGSSNQRRVYAIDAISGALKWTSSVDHRNWANPLILDDILYVGCGSFYAINKNSGELVNRLYFDANKVHPETLSILWNGTRTSSPSDALANLHSSPVYYQGKIFFGCDDGCVYAIDVQKFLTKPFPDTDFGSNEDIDLETIEKNNHNYQLELKVYNFGEGDDFVTANWTGSKIPKSAITLEPGEFSIAAKDSQCLKITIDASQIAFGDYSLNISLSAKLGLEEKLIRKKVKFTVGEVTDVQKSNDAALNFCLTQNYPNPFNPLTIISFSIPQRETVTLEVFDSNGRNVETLVSEEKSAGNYSIPFDASHLSSGIYLYKLQCAQKKIVKKMTILR